MKYLALILSLTLLAGSAKADDASIPNMDSSIPANHHLGCVQHNLQPIRVNICKDGVCLVLTPDGEVIVLTGCTQVWFPVE